MACMARPMARFETVLSVQANPQGRTMTSTRYRPWRSTGGKTPGMAVLAIIASAISPLEMTTASPVTNSAQTTCSGTAVSANVR